MDSGPNNELLTAAVALFSKKIEPLVELFDELQQCLETYRSADSAVEQLRHWQRTETAYRDIMAAWQLALPRARSAVHDHLCSIGSSIMIPEHKELRQAIQNKCVPYMTMAVTLLQFEDERHKRKAAEW